VQDYGKIVEQNEFLAKEIVALRQQKASLQRQLDDHMLSGNCRLVKHEGGLDSSSPACLSPNPFASCTSPSHSFLKSSSSPPSTSLSHNSSSSSLPDADVSAPGEVPTFPPFHSEDYLGDLDGLSPDKTFSEVDLETLMDLVDAVQQLEAADVQDAALVPANVIPLSSTPCQVSLPTSSPCAAGAGECTSVLGEHERQGNNGLMDSLKVLCYPVCTFSPISSPGSPAALSARRREFHDRHPSTSSVASDWSEQSQGFQLVPTGPGPFPTHSPLPAQAYYSVGSVSSDTADEEHVPMDISGFSSENHHLLMSWGREEDDDVFSPHTRSEYA
jgi:hypothetical protein